MSMFYFVWCAGVFYGLIIVYEDLLFSQFGIIWLYIRFEIMVVIFLFWGAIM